MPRSSRRGATAVEDRAAAADPAAPAGSPADTAPNTVARLDDPLTGPVDKAVLSTYRIHPVAALFPLMSDTELREMAHDIREHGLQEPVVRHKGEILDGRNRLVACATAGVQPTFREWKPTGDQSTPVTYVWSANIARRHLTASQRAALGVELEQAIRVEHERIRQENRAARTAARTKSTTQPGTRSTGTSGGTPTAVPATPFSHADAATDQPIALPRTPGTRTQFVSAAPGAVPPAAPTPQGQRPDSPFATPGALGRVNTGRARDQAARMANVSAGYLNDAKDLAQAAPEVFEAVKRAELTIPQAQTQIVEQARADGTLDQVKLRPGVVRNVLQRVEEAERRRTDPKAATSKPRIRLTKAGPVTTSATTVQITFTGGNPAVIEHYLNQLQDDTKVWDLTYEVLPAPAPAKRRRRATGA